jgi:Pili and flagellar-assembly chaperone, PapD N-terminal domain
MRFSLHLLGLVASMVMAGDTLAQSLTFRPQRIVLDARAGTSSLQLTNTGKDSGSYRVELVDMIYQDDGKVVQATKAPAGYPSAKEMIRFSPSQIRLEPGETQTVRILIKPEAVNADGEYRVHAVLRQLPDVAHVKEPVKGLSTVAGVIGIEQSVAIPVIIRRGTAPALGSIVSLKIVDGKPGRLDMSLGRSGNQSIYSILRIKDKSGAVVNEVKGVAVPVPNKTRRFLFPLNDKSTAASLRSGGFTVEFSDHDNSQAVLDKKPIR